MVFSNAEKIQIIYIYDSETRILKTVAALRSGAYKSLW